MPRKQYYIALVLLGLFLSAHCHDWVPHHHHTHDEPHHHSDNGQHHGDHDHSGLISMLSGLLHHHSHVPHDCQAEMTVETTLYKASSKKQFNLLPGIHSKSNCVAAVRRATSVLYSSRVLISGDFNAEHTIGRAPPVTA